MIDELMITPDGRMTESREDVTACLYAIERGLWTAAAYDYDRQAVVLDWGGVERERSKGFCNWTVKRFESEECGQPAKPLTPYVFDELACLAEDYVEEFQERDQWTPPQYTCISQEEFDKAVALRRLGMPYNAIAERVRLKNGDRPSAATMPNWVCGIPCRTVSSNAGKEMLCRIYKSGVSIIEICERARLSRRLVKWILKDWGGCYVG